MPLNEKDQRQLEIARDRMDRYRVALAVLSQGENSPYITEAFKAELEAASVRMEKYRSSTNKT